MDLTIFILLFFLTTVYLMPVAGFSYKLCERMYKRSLFSKGAKQIQFFSAVLLFFCCLALGADFLFEGRLFQANLIFVHDTDISLEIWKNYLLLLIGGSFAGTILCILATKFSKTLFFFALSALIGVFLAVCTYGFQLLEIVSALSYDSFINNPYAVFSSAQLFSYIAVFFILIAIFLYSLYFICLFTFFFRNSMDYGRDYYTFILTKYGRAIFLFSFLVFIFAVILLAGFALPFQNYTADMLGAFTANTVSVQWALIAVPLLYFLFSLKLKKSFYSAQIPMQKKSNIITAFVLDLLFCVLIFALIMNAAKF